MQSSGYTSHGREFTWNKEVQGTFSYYLIAIHEEAGDECAHAQLIADIILLRYRDTFLLTSSETTRALPKMESWVADWLEFFFRSTLSFSSTSGTITKNRLLGKNEIDGRDALVVKWPRLAGGKTRAVVMSSLDAKELSHRQFWVKGSLL
jgi:hypothetical protein